MAGESVPQDDGTLIVTACQKVLVITAPADTATVNKFGITFIITFTLLTFLKTSLVHFWLLPDFGIAGHFVDRVVDVHCILDHGAILKHLDFLGHTSDGKVVTVTVKLNTKTQVRIQSLKKSRLNKNKTFLRISHFIVGNTLNIWTVIPMLCY